MPTIIKDCDRCGLSFRTNERDRYCAPCRKAVRKEMQESGFLTPLPFRRGRGPDACQDRSDEPSPWGENAVRALEDGP